MKKVVPVLCGFVVGVAASALCFLNLPEKSANSPEAVEAESAQPADISKHNPGNAELTLKLAARDREIAALQQRISSLSDVLRKISSSNSAEEQASLAANAAAESAVKEGEPFSAHRTAWTNMGFETASAAAMSWLWSLSSRSPEVYNQATGLNAFSDAEQMDFWAKEMEKVSISTVAAPMKRNDGSVLLTINFKMRDGSSESAWLVMRNDGSHFQVSSVMGFPNKANSEASATAVGSN
jgi:hypothetical protein